MTERFVEARILHLWLVESGRRDKEGLAALDRSFRGIAHDLIGTLGNDVHPPSNGFKPRGPESFLRCISGINQSFLDIVMHPTWIDHFQARSIERKFPGLLEVAMFVAVVAEQDVDVNDVSGPN